MVRTDIISVIKDNDILFGASDEQHIQDSIYMAPGWSKEHPGDGVNIRNYLNSTGQEQKISRAIKLALVSDLYVVETPIVNIQGDKISINPNATI